jgi:hypothetical protein
LTFCLPNQELKKILIEKNGIYKILYFDKDKFDYNKIIMSTKNNLIIVISNVKQHGTQMSIYIYKNYNHKRHSHKWWLRIQSHLQLMANTMWSFGLHSHAIIANHKLHI